MIPAADRWVRYRAAERVVLQRAADRRIEAGQVDQALVDRAHCAGTGAEA
jgi:hypothetical protein